jgi:hypothetical protein
MKLTPRHPLVLKCKLEAINLGNETLVLEPLCGSMRRMAKSFQPTQTIPFSEFGEYARSVQGLAYASGQQSEWQNRVIAALDGSGNRELGRVASLETRREFGAFFTGETLSKRLLARMRARNTAIFFYDPTCGIGDLLIAAARRLPLADTLEETLRNWAQRLGGTDVIESFVATAKNRLVLLARHLLCNAEPLKLAHSELFPHIRCADARGANDLYERATHLLMNPPFGMRPAPPECKWAGGRITAAAEFTVSALERVRPGTELRAVLPDVLRSGSFSRRWRGRVSELAEVHRVEPYGVFDDVADVDVFLLRLVRRKTSEIGRAKSWPAHPQQIGGTISDSFEVRVGRVVPHRDKEFGPKHHYIHARCVPAWEEMRSFPESRLYAGPLFRAPFVAIRRTSRPGHSYRATAAIVGGNAQVAVENHLIVCEPKDGSIASCRNLLRQLKCQNVNEFVDKRIRCRHLTVEVVKEIPYASATR